MANFVQQIKLGEELYDFYDSELIIDNRTAAGAALTGVSKAPVLFDGMQISYWLNHAAGSNATLNLTLADGTKTGAIPVYYSATTRLGTHYAAGNVLHMTYRENAIIAGTASGAGWWCDANYYSDSNYDIFGAAMDVDTAVYNYSLFAITGHNGTIAKQTNTNEAGTYWKVNSFTQSAGIGTSKRATTKGFYPYKVCYNPNNTSYTIAGGNTSTVSSGTSNLDLRYTVNGSTSANIGATGAPFFLVGTIESDGLFYLKGNEATKEWWTAGIPTTKNTDYVYWFVGIMSSAYQVRLSDRNWFLKWTGTGEDDHLIQFEPWFTVEHAESADSVPWSGVTGKPTSFTPSSHSHGYISNDGSIPAAIAASPASGDKIVITDSSDNDKVKGSIAIGSDDGKFLKHDGTWDTPDSGPNTPDAPTTDGNYVLNVNSGNSSWSSVIYTINIERHSGEDTWTLLNDSDEAYSEVAAYVVGDGSTRRPIQFRTIEEGGDIVGVYTGFFPFNFFPVAGGYFYKVNPTLQYRSPYLINPLIHDGWMIAWSILDHSSPIVLLPFSRDIVTSDLLSSSSVLSSASLSGGTTPTITYSAATASKAALTNGLLSFGDVSASNITNWSAGSMPTISTNTITVVTPASS